MAIHSKAHMDFRRSVTSKAKGKSQKHHESKWAGEELALWAVLIVLAVILLSVLLERAC
jgi:hypothetical protein